MFDRKGEREAATRGTRPIRPFISDMEEEPPMDMSKVVTGHFEAPGAALACVWALHRGSLPLSDVSFFSLNMQPSGDPAGSRAGHIRQGIGGSFDASAWWRRFFEAILGEWLTPERALEYEAVVRSGQYLVMARVRASLVVTAREILEGQGALNIETVSIWTPETIPA
jgi:hypothetical protein